MKRLLALILSLTLVVALVGCNQSQSDSPTIQHPYVQEYVIGQGNIKGNVSVDEYISISEDFAIGADKDGYPVFKDPEKALAKLLELYSDGISLIQTEFDLEPLSYDTFDAYKEYGWQITAFGTQGTDEQRAQVVFVEKFIDICENSYERK